MVPINYLAVICNVFIAMGIGFLWYGPLFGKQWASMMGWTQEEIEARMKGEMTKTFAVQALGALLMSFVLAHSIVFASAYLQTSGIISGIQAAIWNWIGFIAPVTVGSVLWEGKSWKLWVLNSGYYLVVLLAMGILLALWP
ncbi:MAG: hypothetical protein RIQ56_644 [Candidatus Parcubacteria bacterium]|jgi:hypothetical protein